MKIALRVLIQRLRAEHRLRLRAERERDEYRTLFLTAVNLRLQHKPAVTEIASSDRAIPVQAQSARRSRAEIDAEMAQKARDDFARELREQQAMGNLPNDVSYPLN